MEQNNQPEIVRASSDVVVVTEYEIDRELVRTSQLRANIGQKLILTTEDRIRICLAAYDKAQEGRHEWKGALGTFLTALGAVLAQEFHPFLGLSGEIWKVGFLVVAVLTAIWTIRSLWSVVANRERCNIENVIKELNRGGTDAR